MDQDRQRIQDDLRGLVDGEVRCDDVFVQMYATDASIYEIRPLGVVRPRGVADVVACLEYAAQQGISIHARGAGTGVAGECLGPGLVLDFSHSMRRILRVDDDTVRVQPGVILAHLNRHLAKRQRRFGPDPATRAVTTMGSVLAIDAAGTHYLQYGSAREHVVSLQVALADGRLMELGSHAVDDPEEQRQDPERYQLIQRVAQLLDREQQTIRESRRASPLRSPGYQVDGVLEDGRLNLARLMVGSEGTLGLITEATVKTVPEPRVRGLALLFFERLELATRASLDLIGSGVATCDLMDRRLLSLAREMDVRYELLIPPQAEAMLLVEQPGEDPHAVGERLRELVLRQVRKRRTAFDARVTIDKEERNFYWRLSRRVVTTLYQLKGSSRAVPFIEDISLPPERIPAFLETLQNVLKAHEVTASLFAHIGHGQLHIRPFLDLENPEHIRKMQELATHLYDEVRQVGGTMASEHAVGLSRTWYLRRQNSALYDVFQEIKRIFDPHHILNPGKIVADVPQPLTKNLRPAPAALPEQEPRVTAGGTGPGSDATPAAPGLFPLQLTWSHNEMALAARACNGCGRCRTLGEQERMCPIFRFAPREEASPRAKANLLRAILTGRLTADALTGDQLKVISDLCVNCHQCRTECPAGVDIPKLVMEGKAQYVATNGLRLNDWLLARVDLLSAWGCTFSSLANWAIANRRMRWLFEKLLGIAQGRKLPRFERRSFLHVARRLKLDRPRRLTGQKVVYFLDVYANWYDADLAEAFIAILQHNGVSVYVHPEQRPSGMGAVSIGAADIARDFARHNVALLADSIRQGYQVVTTEPSAALCLKHEYLNLLDEEDARLVAENTSEACTYLWKMHQSGKLELDLRPINATLGYHLPCHLKILGDGSPGANLLRLIPGLTVQTIDRGCSGMAGPFGLKRQNYRSSLRAGWGLISGLRDPGIQAGTTECSSCKIQMEQGTTKPTIHPLKMLALAYNLKPEFYALLTTRGEDLIVT